MPSAGGASAPAPASRGGAALWHAMLRQPPDKTHLWKVDGAVCQRSCTGVVPIWQCRGHESYTSYLTTSHACQQASSTLELCWLRSPWCSAISIWRIRHGGCICPGLGVDKLLLRQRQRSCEHSHRNILASSTRIVSTCWPLRTAAGLGCDKQLTGITVEPSALRFNVFRGLPTAANCAQLAQRLRSMHTILRCA